MIHELKSTIPGTLAMLHVDDGDRVEVGDPICEVECMKVFQRIVAPFAGIVTFQADLGEFIGQDDVIAEVESQDG